MTTTDLAIQQGVTSLTQEGLDHTRDQLKLLEKFVSDVLILDQDYGVIPGTGDKPTLLKPGAANIIAAFQCHSEPTALTALLDTAGNFVAYEHRVDIIHNQSGCVIASGMGGCNSHETKYRYRNVLPICPNCGKDNIRKSNRGDGYYCWQKTDGCGANFANDHPVANEPAGKMENPDQLDLGNTIMKMSIKRAEVDAAMKLPGVARFFTQDLEDMVSGTAESDAPAQPASKSQARRQTTQTSDKVTVSSAEANGLMVFADELDVPRPDVMSELNTRFALDSPLKMDFEQLEAMREFVEAHSPEVDYETPTDVEDH